MKSFEYKKDIWIAEKEVGMTMGEVVETFKAERGIPKTIPVTFVGRLDPMVDGLVMLLVGEKVHEKEYWKGFDKTYEAEFLLGVSTDTYDIFGIPTAQFEVVDLGKIESVFAELQKLSGTEFTYPYPPFSSKTVGGVPLWLSSREGMLVDAPLAQFKIKKVELAGGYTIPKESIARKVHFLYKRVRGDFRQQAILDSWENIALRQFPIIRATISVGAGTYIRSIAHMVGESTGVQICLSALSRTRIYNDTISLTKGKGQPND